MKKKNYLYLLLAAGCLLTFSSCKKNHVRLGTVQAAVNASCSTNITFQGTHVFAYLDSISYGGVTIVNLIVGGYISDNSEELGLLIPWPIATGTVITGSSVQGYYDPQNGDDGPSDGDSEYGGYGVSTSSITITKLTMAANGQDVSEFEVHFSDIMLTHTPAGGGTPSTLCMSDGVIKAN